MTVFATFTWHITFYLVFPFTQPPGTPPTSPHAASPSTTAC